MPTPQDPSDREIYLAQLSTSDESPEDLLSGGADIDDLIASGQLEIETEGWGWQTSAEVELSEEDMQPSSETEEEARAKVQAIEAKWAG